ncbi:MAG: hypothetical protein GF364_00285, partial [Candidatus Lokiarchaeota archaeon]|nr:hypothetical protein [Candidatus Lokiarchaeota archaeon]
SDRERAAFELGIKLGAVFHIAMGMPVSQQKDVLLSIEKALEKMISCQPYVQSVIVNIAPKKISGKKATEFDYSTINPSCLNVTIDLDYKSIKMQGKLEWNEEIEYPIMHINSIKED